MYKKTLLASLTAVGIAAVLTVPALAADKTVTVNQCDPFVAPAITTQDSVQPTDDVSATVEGTGEPGMTINILNDGVGAAVVTASPGGLFAVDVPLHGGDNHVMARESTCDATKDSNTILLQRTVPAGASGGSAEAPITSLPNSTDDIGADGGNDTTTNDPNSAGSARIGFPKDGDTIHAKRVMVHGTAPAGSRIDIFVNGTAQASVAADENGNFRAMVPLTTGDNTIGIQVTAPDGSTANRSVTIHAEPLGQGGGIWHAPYGIFAVMVGVFAFSAGAVALGGNSFFKRFRRVT